MPDNNNLIKENELDQKNFSILTGYRVEILSPPHVSKPYEKVCE